MTPMAIDSDCDRRNSGSFATFYGWVLLLVFTILCGVDVTMLRAQGDSKLKLDTGKDVYQNACVSCHGVDGKGAARTTVAFDTRLPDFTDCSFATKEPDGDWSATIHNGGPARGFSTIMPAFRDALTDEQVDNVIGYMRGFCTNPAWPRGDLNMPRALVTEKAFPENEVVISSSFNTSRTSGIGTTLILERRVGSSGQIEAALPYLYTKETDSWMHGFGDASIGYKHMLFHNNDAGSIFSVAGELAAPTGDPSKGTGGETPLFETFAAFDQALPADMFVQFRTGLELPFHPDLAPRAWYAHTAVGQSFSAGGGLGRTWTPMVEFIADRDIESGAKTNWDILPQLQIPLSKRMHILGNVGLRVPMNNTAGRAVQFMYYLLWDFADGSLKAGW
jgi:mono/diheme cytochrome c family protein